MISTIEIPQVVLKFNKKITLLKLVRKNRWVDR